MQAKNKLFILAGFLLVLVFASIHTVVLSKGMAGQGYYLFREIGLTILSVGLCVYNVVNAVKDNKNFTSYLVLANAFAIIAAVHILKFFFKGTMEFGGLLC
jgi:hypothetical protein